MSRINHSSLQRIFESEYPWSSNDYKTHKPKSRVLLRTLSSTHFLHQTNLLFFFLGHSMLSPQYKSERENNVDSQSLYTAEVFQIKLHLAQNSKNFALTPKLKLLESRIQRKKKQLNWRSVKKVMSKIVS